MRKTLLIFTSFMSVLLIMACNRVQVDGPVITETRSLTGFTAINSEVDAVVIYSQSPVYSVQIAAQRAILDRMTSEVLQSDLRFYYPGGLSLGRHAPVTIRISGPDVTRFVLNGSGDFRCDSISAPGRPLSIRTAGSGSMRFESLDAAALGVALAGSGSVRIVAGKVSGLSPGISGSGTIDCSGLEAADVSAQISGSGEMRVQASTTLDIRISGSGSLWYRGAPRVTSNITGSGRIGTF